MECASDLPFCLADFFPECVARVPVSLIHSGGLGLRVCSLDVAFTFATVFVWGPYGRAYMVSSAKGVTFGPFGGFKRCVASCRVAGVALCDIPTRFIMCQKYSKVVLCGRRDTFATFSHDELHFSWQMQHFGDLHQYFEWQVQHFRRVMLRVFCELPLSGLRQWCSMCKIRGRHGMLWHVLNLHTSHFTLHTLHTPHLHFTLYTSHSTLNTWHLTLPTLQYTPHSTLHTPHSTVYTPQSTLYTSHTPHTPHIPHDPHFTLYTLNSTLYTLHSTP